MQNVRLNKYLAEKKINKKIATRKKEEATEDKFITMDMPEVKDIPGQEKIKPPRFREMEDVTISSADEEGEGILDDLNKEEEDHMDLSSGSNVSPTEKKLLQNAGRSVNDETKDLKKMQLDNSDGEDVLNEGSNANDMGADLDVPGSDLDDDDEEKGSEDEENNLYSRKD